MRTVTHFERPLQFERPLDYPVVGVEPIYEVVVWNGRFPVYWILEWK